VSHRTGVAYELPGRRRPPGRLFRVLVVCTGNQCRSPAVERMLGRALVAGRETRFDLMSAGTRAVAGLPIHALTAQALRRHGVAVEGHVSQPLSGALVSSGDLVLTATRAHRARVVELDPSAARRCFTFSEFVRLAPAVLELGALNPADLVAGAAVLRAQMPAGEPALDDLPDPAGLGPQAHEAMVAAVQPLAALVAEALLSAGSPVGRPDVRGRRTAPNW